MTSKKKKGPPRISRIIWI